MVSLQFPLEVIVDEAKRQEFLEDYKRLKDRCGYNAMQATFVFYLQEQNIFLPLEEQRKKEPTTPQFKITTIGYKNTSEIIARFVENSWIDFYLADFDVLDELPLIMKTGNSILISQRDSKEGSKDPLVQVFNAPSKDLTDFVDSLSEDLSKNSIYIPPDKIRQVFAEIDRKYAS